MSSLASSDPSYQLHPDGRFVIGDYNRKKPFSNFLPGIAGLYGKPLWVFYVNRGQGVVSFGTKNKDGAILEFYPANKAYQAVNSLGFRTFVKFSGRAKHPVYEPFRESAPVQPEQRLEVSSHEFSVHETNRELGLSFSARYFTLPGEPIAALARELTLTNLSGQAVDLELLDGLPSVNPYGMNEYLIKHMSRTIEAWMIAENMEKKAPFLRLKVDATDHSEVTSIRGGHFYFGLTEERGGLPAGRQGNGKLTEPIVDPSVIFGSLLDFSRPKHFEERAPFRVPSGQFPDNKTPCAFNFTSLKIPAGGSKTLRSVFGQAASIETLNRFVAKAKGAGYFDRQRLENRRLIEGIKAPAFTATASPAYDLYCGQTYLDNVLRGGMPVFFGQGERAVSFYVYSRKHGDLERDYNQFLLEPAYFSQGNGNYRDVNQNRRNDVWFDPRVRDANVRTFLNLVQLDGFNPLVVRGTRFHFRKTAESSRILRSLAGKKGASVCEKFLSHSFDPGEFYALLQEEGFGVSRAAFEKLLNALGAFFVREEKADHAEGFWTDHWTYNLDLIESYLAIYPERLRRLLFEDKAYFFYDNAHRVQPRLEKYFLKGTGVRQFKSVVKDEEKAALIASRTREAAVARAGHGRGEIYRTTLFVKLLCLFANKIASLDPQGAGVEMEADKPSWYDALNGLPGLLGSSLSETFELKRLALFMIGSLEEGGAALPAGSQATGVKVPLELYEFIQKLGRSLDEHFKQKKRGRNFEFWDSAASAKEEFRARTRLGLSGREKLISTADIKLFLEHAREKIEIGLDSVFDKGRKLHPTYFENRVVRHRAIKDRKRSRIEPLEFSQSPLPYFLEGPVHALKVEKDPARRKEMLRAIRGSALYDAQLGMYKVNEPLDSASLEIGRARVFAPGWLENETIWMHMEYKLLLELLRNGMAEEFFEDFRKTLIPFQPAARYGRSILENSSFIVSSSFRDPSLHGAGFVARLSGSTAEFLMMWLLMNIGKRPFLLGPDGKLALRFEPQLPEFLFTKEESPRVFLGRDGREHKFKLPKDGLAFLFLGKTLVVYHNPRRLDTFGKLRASVRKITVHDRRGGKIEFRGDTIPSPYAANVRDEFVPRIDIELG